MKTASEYIEALYPGFFDVNGEGYIQPIMMETFLEIAASYRPKCLSEERQNLAQAYYAAYLAEGFLSRSATGKVVQIIGALAAEREGNVEKRYTNTATAIKANTNDAPNSAYELWSAMNDLCVTFAQIPTERA